jgi:hypothetical protein
MAAIIPEAFRDLFQTDRTHQSMRPLMDGKGMWHGYHGFASAGRRTLPDFAVPPPQGCARNTRDNRAGSPTPITTLPKRAGGPDGGESVSRAAYRSVPASDDERR